MVNILKKFNNKDAVFGNAWACNKVKSTTFQKPWRKHWLKAYEEDFSVTVYNE